PLPVIVNIAVLASPVRIVSPTKTVDSAGATLSFTYTSPVAVREPNGCLFVLCVCSCETEAESAEVVSTETWSVSIKIKPKEMAGAILCSRHWHDVRRREKRSPQLAFSTDLSSTVGTMLSPYGGAEASNSPNSERGGQRNALGCFPAFQMQTAPYRRSGKATLSSLRNVRIKRWRMPCASATGQEAIGGSLEWEFAGVNPHDGKICKLRESSQPPTNVSGTAPPSAVP